MEFQQSSGQQPKFNYAEALQKSYLFYEANRAGDLDEKTKRIPWRGDSTLNDGKDVGRDLSGGYFDAGDHVKFGLPMAASMTMLAWGVDEFRSGYEKVGQLDEALDAIKWGTDYFLNAYDDKGTATTADDVFYSQVGNGQADHAYWGPPETMSMERPTYQVDAANPGSDVTGETAAALASASIIFRSTDAAYADKLLAQAKKLYSFAEDYKGKYSDAIPDVTPFYNSWSGYTDELAWGAAWLHKATKAAGQTDPQYLSKAEAYFKETNGIKYAPFTQNWDDKKYGAAVLLAQETTDPQYKDQVETWLDNWTVDKAQGGIPEYTEGGLAWLSQWGSLRYSANTAMLASVYAETVNDKGGKYSTFAEQQINYMLGDNPNNRSYVVGFGENSPQNPHHRGAHGSTTNNINDGPTKNILYGALVGGPSKPDDNAYTDKRDDYIANEVTTDYNAGFTGALAYMVDKYGGAPLADSEIPKLFDSTSAPPNPVDPNPVDPNPVDPNPVDPTPVAPGVDFSVTNSWQDGFQGEIAITNQGDSQINGWTLKFEYPNEITQIWNAEILSHTGNTYVIHDAGYDGVIAPNGKASFGFTANGSPSSKPSSFELNGQVLGAPTTPTPVDPTPVDPAPVDPAPVDPAPVDPAPVDAIRINVGGDAFTDSSGNVWEADKYFVGGDLYNTAAEIGQTTDDTLSQSERFQQNLSYAIPVENGDYTVNLNFAEIYFDAAGKRVFDVSAEGALQLDNYDIYAKAGGKNQQVQESLQVKVTDGVLNLDLNASVNNAKLSSIEVLKASSVDPTPVDPDPVDPHPGGEHNHPEIPLPDNVNTDPLAEGGQIFAVDGTTQRITNFDPSKDRVNLGLDSIHNQIPIDTPDGLVFQNYHHFSRSLTLVGVNLKDLTAANFTPISDAHLQQDLSAALAWENGSGNVRDNTVYIRSHEEGLQEVVDFNPATDKISFFYLSVRGDNQQNFSVEQTDQGVRFYSPITEQSITLKGTKFSDLNSSHFEWRANQLEDNIAERMGLSDKIADFSIVNDNVFSGKSVAMAGLVDRAPYHTNHPDYTGTRIDSNPAPVDPTGNPVGPMPDHNHNHNPMMAASMTTMAPDLAASPDSSLAATAFMDAEDAGAGSDFIGMGADIAGVASTPAKPSLGNAGVKFDLLTDWGSGFQGKIFITNQGAEPLSEWTLEFEFDSTISEIWNAEIASHTGNRYVIRNTSGKGNFKPGETIHFAFNAEGSAPSSLPSVFEFNGQLVGGASTPTSPVGPTLPVDPATPMDAIRINVGGEMFTDGSGNVWQADKYFVGGNSYSTTAEIGQTTDDTLSQSERFQKNLAYAIPVENGDYTVNLNFAEIYFDAAGQRVFDVFAEGALQLDNYDIYAKAGGKNQQLQESLKVKVTDGVLNLNLDASANNAKLSSIEVLKASSVDPTPVDPPVDPAPAPPPNTTFVGGGKTYKFERGKTITGFDVTKDMIDLGPESIHVNIPVQTKDGLTFQFQWDKGVFTLAGVDLKDLTINNFAPIKDDHLREDVSSVLTWAKGTAITRPNTVYIRSHQQGLQEEVDFNPATDKINFMYYGNRGENSTVEETARGVKFFSKVTGQSMLLKGVKLSDLNGSHFEFRMAQFKEDDLPTRMGLSTAVKDFNVPDSNVYSREGIPTAGIQDRDWVYLSGYTQEYTGTTTNGVSEPHTQTYEPPAGSIGPMPVHNHNHNHASNPMAAALTASMPKMATPSDSLLAPAASMDLDSSIGVNFMDGSNDPLLASVGGGESFDQLQNMTHDVMGSSNSPSAFSSHDILSPKDPMINSAPGVDFLAGQHLPMTV